MKKTLGAFCALGMLLVTQNTNLNTNHYMESISPIESSHLITIKPLNSKIEKGYDSARFTFNVVETKTEEL